MGSRRKGTEWERVAKVLLAAIGFASASDASVYGPLDNFDVVNDTGHDQCGFEIEIEDVHSGDIYRTFDAPYIRYGTPALIDTPTGVIVRYRGAWDPVGQTWLQKTPPAAPGYVPASDSCWTVGLGPAYDASGCEHFGVSQTTQATSTRYRWLDCHPDGTTSPGPDLGIPTPTWTVTPPAAAGDPPVVRAEIELPNPEGGQYGDAYWVKIYKTEAEGPIDLDQLLLDDALIAGAETEIEWELMQAKPGQGMVFHEAELGDGNDAVVRRYEFYHYDRAWGLAHGYVDPENGEVMECVVDGCNDPTPDELGDFAGRQMAGFNIEPAACGDETDDDGDGLVDMADPGCRDVTQASESPECQDGVNNDGRPGIDFDGGASANGGVALDVPDPHCTTAYRGTEAAPRMCGFGAELAVGFVLLNAARRRSRVRAAR